MRAWPPCRKCEREFELPILTDVHTEQQVQDASEAVDILQIPHFSAAKRI